MIEAAKACCGITVGVTTAFGGFVLQCGFNRESGEFVLRVGRHRRRSPGGAKASEALADARLEARAPA